MIYINSNSGSIQIPRHTYDYSQWYKLTLYSHLSDEVNLVEEGENVSTNMLYYKFAIFNTDALNVGEYTYKLYNSDDVMLEKGLVTFGNYNRTVVVNNTFNDEIIQYNG